MVQEITYLVNQTKFNLENEIIKSIIYVYWNIVKTIVANKK